MSYKKVKLSHICLKALEAGHTYRYPIFYQYSDNIYRVLIEQNTGFTKETQAKIDDLKISDVYVLLKDHPKYEKDTQTYISKLVYDNTFPIHSKADIIHEMANDTMQELFDGELHKSKIDRSQALINHTISLILNDERASKAMMKVTSYDYYTYSHCVNVSIYALGFGAYLGFTPHQLHILGAAAILHDLGKQKIPSEIVNKNGKLTDEEFEIMKSHPTYAVEILKSLGEKNKIILTIIEQHHEKMDGSGYPKQLTKEKIHPFSQIVAIADIFDALTTRRSYKKALRSYDALDIMSTQMKHEINMDLLEKFILFMSKHITNNKNI